MDHKGWYEPVPKLVHVNPNFVNRQQLVNQIPGNTTVIPHINPKFRNIHINKLMTSNCHPESQLLPLLPVVTENPKIHFNPRILNIAHIKADMSLHDDVLKKPEFIVLSKNKIVKNEQPASLVNTLPLPTTNNLPKCNKAKRKPSYSLVRKRNEPVKKQITNVVKANASFSKNTLNTFKGKEQAKPNIKVMQSTEKKYSCLEKLTPVKKKINYSNSVVFVRGEKFIIRNNTMQRVVMPNSKPATNSKTINRICVSGVTYIRKNNNVFTVDNRMKNSMKKLKKVNIPCPAYRKFGFCSKLKMNKCSLVHDPKNISVCSKFIKGVCKNDKCKLSHQVVAEKMMTCKFYLKGFCVRENCPYPHVKVKDSAKICLEFIRGFCSKGKLCESKHVHICPEFNKNGKCDRKQCPFPHRQLKTKGPTMPSAGNSNKNIVIKPVHDIKIKAKEIVEVSRYFEEKETQKEKIKDDISLNEKQGNYLENRPKLGKLPSFISL